MPLDRLKILEALEVNGEEKVKGNGKFGRILLTNISSTPLIHDV